MLHCVHLSGIEFSPIEIGLYIILDPVAIIVTRCTNLVSVHYFLPLGI